jgi:hypothetical protein
LGHYFDAVDRDLDPGRASLPDSFILNRFQLMGRGLDGAEERGGTKFFCTGLEFVQHFAGDLV